jgi:hypothetical protein
MLDKVSVMVGNFLLQNLNSSQQSIFLTQYFSINQQPTQIQWLTGVAEESKQTA